jgi:hypothetical protein
VQVPDVRHAFSQSHSYVFGIPILGRIYGQIAKPGWRKKTSTYLSQTRNTDPRKCALTDFGAFSDEGHRWSAPRQYCCWCNCCHALM